MNGDTRPKPAGERDDQPGGMPGPEWGRALQVFAAAAPEAVRWMLMGSAASAIQGAAIIPGDVDVLVHPDTPDDALTPLAGALSRYAVGPATVDPETFRSTREQPWLDAGTWRFGRWMVGGCKLEVARIREGLASDALVEGAGYAAWRETRLAAFDGHRVPVLPLEIQLATARLRGLGARELAIRAALDRSGWNIERYARACAARGLVAE